MREIWHLCSQRFNRIPWTAAQAHKAEFLAVKIKNKKIYKSLSSQRKGEWHAQRGNTEHRGFC